MLDEKDSGEGQGEGNGDVVPDPNPSPSKPVPQWLQNVPSTASASSRRQAQCVALHTPCLNCAG